MPRQTRFVAAAVLLALLGAFGSLAGAAPQRNLIVLFNFHENSVGVEEAARFLLERMVRPGDQLIIQSPARVYGFSAKTLSQPKAELIAAMGGKLRTDIAQAAQQYQQVIADLQLAARNIASFAYPDLSSDGGLPEVRDMTELFAFYRQGLGNLAQLRQANDASLRRLTAAFQGQKGDNHVIVLFEREFRPVPRREALNALADMPKFAFQANELFTIGAFKEPFDVAAMIGYFAQLPLTQHFVYVTSKVASSNASQIENSGDVYSAFSQIAKATGGVMVTTAEPADGLKAIVKNWKE